MRLEGGCEEQQILKILDFQQKADDRKTLELPQSFPSKAIAWHGNKTKSVFEMLLLQNNVI